MPGTAAVALLVLLLGELALSVLVLSSLCSLPDQLGGCLATALIFPFAGVLSPLICLSLLGYCMYMLRGVRSGYDVAVSRASSGYVCRLLRLGALWNVVSLPNASIGLISFLLTPTFMADDVTNTYLWLLPLLLLLTKLVEAQAIKAVVASSGISSSTWGLLVGMGTSGHDIVPNRARRNTSLATSLLAHNG